MPTKSVKTGMKGGSRTFGLEGAGKGDGDRTTDQEAYSMNLEEVKFPRVPASQDPTFQKTKRGYVKVYGATEPKPDVVEIEPAPASPAVPSSPNEIAPEL